MGPDGVVRSYGKVNIANQSAYSNCTSNSSCNNSSSSISKSKVIKRSTTGMPPHLAGTGHPAGAVSSGGHQQHQQNLIAASCAAFNSSGSGLEGGLPSGPRWDIEKTSMAAVPRDFQAGPESLPIKSTNASLLAAAAVSSQAAVSSNANNNNGNSYQPSATMYRNPSVVGKRDAMLSGGCGVYSNSSNNNNNNNLRNNNNTELGLTGSGGGSGSLWDSTAALLEKSPMATIPRDYQAGPEHMACSKMSAGVGSMLAASSGHSLMRSGGAGVNGSSYQHHHHLHHHHQSSSASEKAALFAGKYRQHQRASHRLHPYMMTSSMGGSFPPLMAPAFPQMQQVSCYNV